MNKKKVKKIIGISATALGTAFIGMNVVARMKKKNSVYEDEPEQKNPMAGKKVEFITDENDKENADGVKGHLVAVGISEGKNDFYGKYVKRAIDVVLSFGGLVVLSPLYACISLAIKIDDPGPVLFTQKRVGQNKEYFKLHKFRSMKMSTPHDVPTHMLENPEQYITRVGKFLRKYSLDELPQIWDIFVGNMSIIGPRPGLWNQDLLTAERDKYGANDIKPGLTGWAQINGRDELEIADKARLDGEYVQRQSLLFDIKCFFGTVKSVAEADGVVEGGTGEMAKIGRHYTDGVSDKELIGNIGFGSPVEVNRTAHKRVLITGAGSYIGEAFKKYASEYYDENFEIDAIDMLNDSWRNFDFSSYDIVYHVAGIAHSDVGNVSEEIKEKYYVVNTDLAVEVAKKAKESGVKEFIFMSSMIVYGDSAPYGKNKVIDFNTLPTPANFYGDSKLQADVAVRNLADEKFTVIVLRPPMIYGKGSKGNYPTLAKLAKKLPVFPDVDNERSMLHIDNLCEFLCQVMLVKAVTENAVVLIPQNGEWTKTSQMVKEIAEVSGKNIKLLGIMRPAVVLGGKVHGKIGDLVNKAFGNMTYDQSMSSYEGMNYRVVKSLRESVVRTENVKSSKRVLILASVASMIDQFNIPNIRLLQGMGYTVNVACNFEKGSTCTAEKIAELKFKLTEIGVMYYQIDFDRNVMNLSKNWTAYMQVKEIVKEKGYTFIHCHSPIGGVIGRIVGHKLGVKVIYTVHGFHFYDGAPKKNWMIYYPVEKFLSGWTDTLITINKEDFERAKNHFHAKRTVYIPGIGVDTEKFRPGVVDVAKKRSELGVEEDELLLFSVGELSARKNHEVMIRAIAVLPEEIRNRIRYFICGQGDLEKYLESLSYDLNVNVTLLGSRADITELCCAADLFVFPSRQEGIPVALMEAVACRTPIICSDIRGNNDIVKMNLFNPSDIDGIVELLSRLFWNGSRLYTREELRQTLQNSVSANYNCLLKFDLAHIEKEMQKWEIRFLKLELLFKKKVFMDQLGIPDDGVILLSVGELNDNKNHATVIKALAQLNDKRLHYCIAGTGVLKDTLLEMAESAGVNLHLLGYREDVPELMRISDLYLLPSHREGLNVSLMEAMSSGMVCVCSDIRGNRDLLDVRWRVGSEDVKGWSRLIEQAIGDSSGVKNRRQIESFSRAIVEDAMKEIYETLC